jgi:hypothetical protein
MAWPSSSDFSEAVQNALLAFRDAELQSGQPELNHLYEVGAKHYQHPLRTERDFGSYMDNFSAWVIYLSLLALAAQPDLWRTFGGEVERLILRQQDYESPDRSAVLRTLENCPDHQVRSIARLFESLLPLRPREIPSLNGQLEAPLIGNPDARSSWLDDHVPHLREAASENTANVNGALADRSWILDGIQREVLDHNACFERSPVLERIAIAVSTIGIAVSILLWQLSVFGYEVPAVAVILVAISNFIILGKGYLSEKSVQKAAELRAKRLRLASSRKTTEDSLGESLRKQERLRENFSAQPTGTAKGSEALKREEDKEIDALRTNCRLLLQSVDAKRIAAKRQLVDALATVRRTFDTNVTDLDRQLNEVDFAEGQELAHALKTSQLQHLQSVLSGFSISDTEIPKVGRSFRLRLVASGFKTAMEIDASVIDVAGIGPVRAAALKAWKADLEARARTNSLKTVPTDNEAIVRAKFRQQRDWLKSERERCRLRLLHEERSERTRNRTYVDALANDEMRLREDMSDKEDEVRSAKAQQWDVLNFEQENVRRQREEELRKISEQISQLHKDLFRIKCDAANLDPSIEATKDVRFSRYVARVFWSVK